MDGLLVSECNVRCRGPLFVCTTGKAVVNPEQVNLAAFPKEKTRPSASLPSPSFQLARRVLRSTRRCRIRQESCNYGSYALEGQGYLPLCPALQADPSQLVQDHTCGGGCCSALAVRRSCLRGTRAGTSVDAEVQVCWPTQPWIAAGCVHVLVCAAMNETSQFLRDHPSVVRLVTSLQLPRTS